MSSSEDEDLNRAIALSLGKHDPVPILEGTSVKEAIDLDSDGEATTEIHERKDDYSDAASARVTDSGGGILGLNRKEMEAERLARKRRRSISPPTSHKKPQQKPIRNDPELFSTGTVKKTWVLGHERAGDDIKIEEIMQKDDLQTAILSSFQWDITWLLTKVDMERSKVTLVMQAKDQATRTQYQQETARMGNLRLCFPSMEGQINCMHSKLMLLSHPTYLRIVVPTANLVRYDWGETGEMENMVFLIDLPRLPKEERITKDVRKCGRSVVRFKASH